MNLRSKTFQCFLVTLFITFVVIIYYATLTHTVSYEEFWDHELNDLTKIFILKTDENKEVTFESDCECNGKSNRIHVLKSINADNVTVYGIYELNNTNSERIFRYNLSEHEMKTSMITCSRFHSLRRGKNQRIVSFSLYGRDEFYYTKLQKLTELVKEFYPGWIIRIYHDDTIDKSVKCELECLATGNIDFCSINKMVLNLDPEMMLTLDAYYVHAMKWRWLPIGDSFVDVFTSRDADSVILKREVDSVNEWLNSSKFCHIMRDNPEHFTKMLGGMIGFYNQRDRSVANHIFSLIIDRRSSAEYNANGNSPKRNDQEFLAKYVYPLVEGNSIVHDSYLCKWFPGSRPWPSRRVGNCFVGSPSDCNINESNSKYLTCPKKCRPKSHPEWTTC
jgi:hypothetical protein